MKHRVRIGQVWRDNDKRSRHRIGEVINVDDTHATILWNAGSIHTRVRLDCFRANSTGYTLERDAPESDALFQSGYDGFIA